MPEVSEDANHQRRQPRCPHAKGLALHMRRVCQRTEDVKNRPDPELTPRRARVPHRRMERGREAKSHARLHDTAAHPLWPEHDVNAERLKHVGASTAAGRGPVAMLCDSQARARGHERRGGRDVEGAGAVAAGTAGIDRLDRERQRCGMRPHRIDKAGHLLHGLSLRTEGDHNTRDLHGSCLTGHDLVHHFARLGPIQGLATEQVLDRFAESHGRGYWYAAGAASPIRASKTR